MTVKEREEHELGKTLVKNPKRHGALSQHLKLGNSNRGGRGRKGIPLSSTLIVKELMQRLMMFFVENSRLRGPYWLILGGVIEQNNMSPLTFNVEGKNLVMEVSLPNLTWRVVLWQYFVVGGFDFEVL